MIRKLHLSALALVLLTSFISGCATAEPSVLSYIRQDGQQFIRIDPAEETVKFIGKDSQESDFGGLIKQCNAAGFRCLNLSGYFLSTPHGGSASDSWSVGGANFTVVGHADRGNDEVWLIQVSVKGDSYMSYTFSEKRGVESISLQQEGATPDLAKTYFLVGNYGLLTETARPHAPHP